MGINPRRFFTDLPTESELGETLAAEAKRAIPVGKENLHFASVDPLLEFLKQLGANTVEFSLEKNWQEVLGSGQKLIEQLLPLILRQDPQEIMPSAQRVYRYLAEEDKSEPADLILAFGAKTMARAEKAIELYKKGLASKLMFTGNSPLYQRTRPEAEVYKEAALEAGVPEENIILETNSITLPDNVRSSLNLLDKIGFTYQRIILVNSPYAQRRGFGHMQKYVSEGVKIYRVNCSTREDLRENNWFTNEEGIKYVLGEYGKIWIGLVTNTI